MDRQTFKSLPLEEQVNYVNERPGMTMSQIGAEVGIPASTLSNLFSRAGYQRIKGVYVKTTETEAPQNDDLQELLQYKEQIIAMVLREQQDQSSDKMNFSFLNNYDDKNKKTASFDLPSDFAKEMEDFIEATGYKKRSVIMLAIYEFMQRHG
jgi:hypothetical protein